MNWYKIKTVLIILFLCIDLFLITWNMSIDTMSNRVDEKTINQSIEILERNGITADRALIPVFTPEMKSLTFVNAAGSPAQFLGNVLGDSYTKNGNVFSSGTKSVTIDKNTFTVSVPGNISGANDAKNFLLSIGIDLSNAVLTETSNGFLLTQKVDDYQVFGSEISVSCTGNNIIASGIWVTPKAEQRRENLSVRHITSILPRFITDPARPDVCTVVNVEFGYGLPTITGSTMEEFAEGVSVPVWRIETDNGQCFYYSAANDSI